jgi:hypothetical protein
MEKKNTLSDEICMELVINRMGFGEVLGGKVIQRTELQPIRDFLAKYYSTETIERVRKYFESEVNMLIEALTVYAKENGIEADEVEIRGACEYIVILGRKEYQNTLSNQKLAFDRIEKNFIIWRVSDIFALTPSEGVVRVERGFDVLLPES